MSAANDAAKTLGEAVLHTAIVSPKGQGKKILTAGALRGVAGTAGAMAGEAIASRKRQPTREGSAVATW